MLLVFDFALKYMQLAAAIAAFIFIFFKHRTGTLSGAALKKPVLVLAAFLGCVAIARIAVHYLILKHDASFGVFLLPPHQPWNWFARMAISRYVFPYAVSVVAALFMYVVAIWTNKIFSGELFAEEDKYIFAVAALAVGWPNFVVYLGTAVILTVFLSGAATLRHGADTRIVLTDALIYAIPAALILGIPAASWLPLYKLTIFA